MPADRDAVNGFDRDLPDVRFSALVIQTIRECQVFEWSVMAMYL